MSQSSTLVRRFGLPELSLVGVTMIWGCTFLIVKSAVTADGALGFVGLRFGAAAVLVALIFHKSLLGFTKAEILAGCAIGASICAGYSLQTHGLSYISSSKSAFITSFYVPLVPLLQWVFLRKSVPWLTWIAILVAFAGVTLLAGPDGLDSRLGKGEVLTAIGALAIAIEILLISTVGKGLNTARVTVAQLFFTSVFAFVCMPVVGESMPELSDAFVTSAVGLGVASALIQFVMNWAQKHVSATKATLIYAGEPVWAGIVGRIAGERITWVSVIGALMIVASSILSEWKPKRQSVASAA